MVGLLGGKHIIVHGHAWHIEINNTIQIILKNVLNLNFNPFP